MCSPPLRRAAMENLERRLLFAAYQFQTLAPLDVANAASPRAGLVLDSQGDLFGTLDVAGNTSTGEVFELPAGSDTVQTLGAFSSANSSDSEGLALDSAGDVFGTAPLGGPDLLGSVFEIPASTTTHNVQTIADFISNSDPDDLVIDSHGNLFGTTEAGNGNGTVFEIPVGGDSINTVASFSPNSSGFSPNNLIDSHGNLYGTALGGVANDGEIFEIPSGSSGTIDKLFSSFGSAPSAYGIAPQSLIRDSQGDLFGTTSEGGANGDGTIFEYSSGVFSTLAQFASADGTGPFDLVRDALGDLFGVCQSGGANGAGTVFELPAGGQLTPLFTFPSGQGQPTGLVIDGQGDLFGATAEGGENGDGSVFEMTPAPATQLVFATQPTNLTAGNSLTTSIVVDADDQANQIAIGYNSNVTLGLKVEPTDETFTPITVQAVDGIATFSDIPAFDLAGGYKLKATQSGLTPGKSDKFFVAPAAASQVGFVQQPTNKTSGNDQGPITVAVEDQFGNVITDDDSTLITLDTKVAPAGVTFDPISMDDADGLATFTDISFAIAGGYKLKATATGLSPGKSAKFYILA